MTYDFAIIGGGIAGISAAARLAPHGKTLVLEGETELAYHTSGRSAAMFEKHYGAASVNALSFAGEDYLTNANGGVLSERGILMVAQQDQKAELASEADSFHMDTITAQEACALVPILDPGKVAHAAFSTGAKDIDTDLLIQNFAREARAHGADIYTDNRVAEIERTAQGWRISAGKCEYSARILINAAGAWADQIAPLAGIRPIGLQAYRRSMARIPAPGGHDVSRWPMLFGCGETWYAKPDAGQLIVSPADEDPVAPFDAYADDMVLALGIARYSEMVTTEVTRMTSNWAGLRTFAPDRTLVIGFDTIDPDFFWLAGQGGYGFQTSPAASALVAHLIVGQTCPVETEIIAALSPSRFD